MISVKNQMNIVYLAPVRVTHFFGKLFAIL